MLSVIMLCRYAECRYGECRYGECHGAVQKDVKVTNEEADSLSILDFQGQSYKTFTVVSYTLQQ
jgi:hypothetical protein